MLHKSIAGIQPQQDEQIAQAIVSDEHQKWHNRFLSVIHRNRWDLHCERDNEVHENLLG